VNANPQPINADIDAAELARKRSQRRRSIVIALGLVAFCVLFYVITIVRLGPAVFVRAL
jgi:hypothetical protein